MDDNNLVWKRGSHMIEERSDYFLLAYDAPNFSAAAAQIPMTPQGFTKIIKNLERDLGVPLFETDKSGVRHPTAYADEYYQYAKHLQSARSQLESAFKRIASEGQIDLKVACALGIPGFFGADAIQRYSKDHPNVNIVYSEVPDALCDSLVRDGFFDVGLTVQPAAEGLSTVNLISSDFMIWVNADDPLSTSDRLAYEDLVGKTIAMPGKDFRVFANFKNSCAQRGVLPPTIVEYAEIFWIYYFVLSGKGLGISLPHLASLEMFKDSDHVRVLPFETLEWKICFSWPGDRSLTAHEKGYLESLQKEAKRLKRAR